MFNSNKNKNIKVDTLIGNNTEITGNAALCEALELGTFTNWRLPTIEELVYITDKGRRNPSIDPEFENVSSTSGYWSSTTFVDDTNYAWGVRFFNGNGNRNGKTNDRYVRCVRDGQ